MLSNLALISAVLISIFLDKISAINGTNTPTTTKTTANLLKNVSPIENIAAINETELEKELTILDDYKNVLSYEQFDDALRIYSNKSRSSLDRERAFVDYLSRELTDEQVAKLPVPISFRHFSEEMQETLKDIYYKRGVSFDEKVYRIGLVVQRLPVSNGNGKLPKDIGKPSDNVLVDIPVNDQPDSNAVEFELNVTTTYNGYFEKEHLKKVLNAEEQTELNKILAAKMPYREKNYAVGRILRKAYQRNPNKNLQNWPTMFSTHVMLTNAQHHAVTHMLFATDPLRRNSPLVDVLKQIVIENEQQQQRLKAKI